MPNRPVTALASVTSIAAIAAAWAICLAQLSSVYMVWRTGAGVYGTPGALAFSLYVPVFGCYLIASHFSRWRAHLLISAAPVVGLVAFVAID